MGAAEKLNDEKPNPLAGIAFVPATWVRPRLLMPLFGITTEAANTNRQRGVWLEMKHWKKDPQGNVVYNWREIDIWNAQ
jgi:hypothetical protein